VLDSIVRTKLPKDPEGNYRIDLFNGMIDETLNIVEKVSWHLEILKS